MESLSVDLTYGQALFEAARDNGKLKEISSELDSLGELFTTEPQFFELIKTPTISAKEKKIMAEKIFVGQISKEMLNFLFVLIDKRRVFNFDGINKVYKKLLDEEEGVTQGEVYSVIELSPEEMQKLEDSTSKLIQKKVKLENKIDESLIGGVKVYIDGKLIDASIKKRLSDLKEVLV